MIDACVSTHDDRPNLPEVLDSILAQVLPLGGRARVIDNGSADGGPEWVRRNRPEVEVLELGSNRGPGASRNAALTGPGGDWVFLLDGDCSLAPGCVEALLRERSLHPADVYSARVVHAREPERIYYDAGEAHFLGLLCLENAHAPALAAAAPSRAPGAVSTSALLVRRAAARGAGLFDEDYFFFGEDLDFSLRLRAFGFRLRHVPEAVVLHHKPAPGSPAAQAASRRAARLRGRRQSANRWRTLLKVCSARTLLRTAPLQLAYQALETLDAAREGNAAEHCRGLAEAAADLPAILRRRRVVQAGRAVCDSALFGSPALAWRPHVLALPGARAMKRLIERVCARLWTAGLALLCAAAAAGAARAQEIPCAGCSLVVVGLDDVRADRLAPDKMPRLARFAADSADFTQAVSAAPWTLPSFISWFTSLYPSHHGMLNRFSDPAADPPVAASLSRSRPGAVTLAEVLRSKGFRTAAFTGGAALAGGYGLSAGFEVYSDSVPFGGFALTVPGALAWLDARQPSERFFLFVHGYDAHGFHSEHFSAAQADAFRKRREDGIVGVLKPSSAAERAERARLYDEAVRRLDRNLGPLLDRLERPDLAGRVIVALGADHGEELFEHGGVDHGMTLYDELLRVPLVIRIPGQKRRRVDFQVRSVDLMPTLLDMLSVAAGPGLAAQMEGASLAPALRGEKMVLDAFCETDFLLHSSLRGLRTADGWKGIYDRRTLAMKLFHLPSDPLEREDLAAKDPPRRRSMEKRIMDAFDQEPLAADSVGTVEGRWKRVREDGKDWKFDLWADPLRGKRAKPAGPAPVPPEVLEKVRKEGYW